MANTKRQARLAAMMRATMSDYTSEPIAHVESEPIRVARTLSVRELNARQHARDYGTAEYRAMLGETMSEQDY